jgi:hypothetical protein
MTDVASTSNVAQAISFAIDEIREFGTSDGEMGLFLSRDPDRSPERDLCVTEVSAELQNAANGLMSKFTVSTSDGRRWTVRVTPEA